MEFMTQIANSSIGAPNCWPLWPNGDLPIGPQWSNFLKQFRNKSKLKGSQFHEKYSHHKNLGPYREIGGLPFGLKWSNFQPFQIERGTILWKNSHHNFLEPYIAGHFKIWGVWQSAQNVPIRKKIEIKNHFG